MLYVVCCCLLYVMCCLFAVVCFVAVCCYGIVCCVLLGVGCYYFSVCSVV